MKLIRIIIINILVLLLLFIIAEGISSYAIVIYNGTASEPIVAERMHTQYDPEIGWINVPNTFIPDFYGQGRSLTINKQGFRNKQNFNSLIPKDKMRIVCSGDSFTLGYGVDDDSTWVQILSSLDTCFQTINMGQGGYGVDQAYLLFKHEIDTLQLNMQILAFIVPDLERMQSKEFLGYGKPILKLENGDLKIENVPVPNFKYKYQWIMSKINSLKDLRTISVINYFKGKFKSNNIHINNISTNYKNIESQKILYEVFRDLKEINESKNSQLVLLLLPMKENYFHYSNYWAELIENLSADLEIPFINIINDFQELPSEYVNSLFISQGQLNYIGAAGHLSNYGNRFIAEILYKNLKDILKNYKSNTSCN